MSEALFSQGQQPQEVMVQSSKKRRPRSKPWRVFLPSSAASPECTALGGVTSSVINLSLCESAGPIEGRKPFTRMVVPGESWPALSLGPLANVRRPCTLELGALHLRNREQFIKRSAWIETTRFGKIALDLLALSRSTEKAQRQT